MKSNLIAFGVFSIVFGACTPDKNDSDNDFNENEGEHDPTEEVLTPNPDLIFEPTEEFADDLQEEEKNSDFDCSDCEEDPKEEILEDPAVQQEPDRLEDREGSPAEEEEEGANPEQQYDEGEGVVEEHEEGEDGGDLEDGDTLHDPEEMEESNPNQDFGEDEMYDEDCGDGSKRALWIQTDYSSNSNPERSGNYGSSEAAHLLEGYDVQWEKEHLDDVDLSPFYLMHYDLVVLYGKGELAPLDTVEAAVLEYWVLQGGSLMYHTYHPTPGSCAMLNSLPSGFGLTCVPGNQVINGTGYPVVAHPINNGLDSVSVLGGELWDVHAPAEVVVADSSGVPLVSVVDYGYGRVVGINDEWPLYNGGTGGSDISAADNMTLVDNAFCWLMHECNTADDIDVELHLEQ